MAEGGSYRERRFLGGLDDRLREDCRRNLERCCATVRRRLTTHSRHRESLICGTGLVPLVPEIDQYHRIFWLTIERRGVLIYTDP